MTDSYADCPKCRNRVPEDVLLEVQDGTRVCRNCLLTTRIGPKISHSVRLHEEIWESARVRADNDGTTVNRVVEELLEGYADGRIDRPRVAKHYGASLRLDTDD